ncbi:chemotaxis protein CheW [uncultured Oxalicibacterium sp.]|uniref:chemotaxis protein CheW n=1 Tax=uncultured Oxalicibacterium sp. TaxID=1168540 RepID=UPI0025CEEF54|nr:chemotaxis protein CheW [uncultured Oxalicibacterium sp.]
MLFLLFRIGEDRYALDAAQIDIVLPLAPCKQIPGAPAWVAGLLVHQGRHVPVIDISMLATGIPCVRRLSTRIVLVPYQTAAGEHQMLGLQIEHATATLRCNPDDFTASGIDHGNARYLGPVLQHEGSLIQRITVKDLLGQDVQKLLFSEALQV